MIVVSFHAATKQGEKELISQMFHFFYIPNIQKDTFYFTLKTSASLLYMNPRASKVFLGALLPARLNAKHSSKNPDVKTAHRFGNPIIQNE